MQLMSEWRKFEFEGNVLSGYSSMPARSGSLPGVLVIQEVWGVDSHIQDVADRVAASGYSAFAPDLLAVDGERPSEVSFDRIAEMKEFMNSLPPSSWGDPQAREAALGKLPSDLKERLVETQAAAFSQIAKLDQYVEVLKTAVRWMQSDGSTKGEKIGTVGFCMGGSLVGRLACADSGISVGVIFYGSAPPIERVSNLSCPLFGFYGGEDPGVNATLPDFSAAVEENLKNAEFKGRFSPTIYPGANHGFHNDTRPSFNQNASRDAWAKTLGIFLDHLCDNRANGHGL